MAEKLCYMNQAKFDKMKLGSKKKKLQRLCDKCNLYFPKTCLQNHKDKVHEGFTWNCPNKDFGCKSQTFTSRGKKKEHKYPGHTHSCKFYGPLVLTPPPSPTKIGKDKVDLVNNDPEVGEPEVVAEVVIDAMDETVTNNNNEPELNAMDDSGNQYTTEVACQEEEDHHHATVSLKKVMHTLQEKITELTTAGKEKDKENQVLIDQLNNLQQILGEKEQELIRMTNTSTVLTTTLRVIRQKSDKDSQEHQRILLILMKDLDATKNELKDASKKLIDLQKENERIERETDIDTSRYFNWAMAIVKEYKDMDTQRRLKLLAKYQY